MASGCSIESQLLHICPSALQFLDTLNQNLWHTRLVGLVHFHFVQIGVKTWFVFTQYIYIYMLFTKICILHFLTLTLPYFRFLYRIQWGSVFQFILHSADEIRKLTSRLLRLNKKHNNYWIDWIPLLAYTLNFSISFFLRSVSSNCWISSIDSTTLSTRRLFSFCTSSRFDWSSYIRNEHTRIS